MRFGVFGLGARSERRGWKEVSIVGDLRRFHDSVGSCGVASCRIYLVGISTEVVDTFFRFVVEDLLVFSFFHFKIDPLPFMLGTRPMWRAGQYLATMTRLQVQVYFLKTKAQDYTYR